MKWWKRKSGDPPNGGLKRIGGYRDERMENKFWGEEVRVSAELESAELGDLGEKVGVEPGEEWLS